MRAERTCEVCAALPPGERTKDPSRRPRPLLLQDRIAYLCDPHGEQVVGTGAETVEELRTLCSEPPPARVTAA